MKMPAEVPEFKNCCCCLPLKTGLLSVCYLKLILVVSYFILLLYQIKVLPFHYKYVFNIIMLVLYCVHVVLTITFVIATHKENLTFVKIYYYYGVVETALVTCWVLVSIGFLISVYLEQEMKYLLVFVKFYAVPMVVMMIISSAIEPYVIIFLSSLQKKIRNAADVEVLGDQVVTSVTEQTTISEQTRVTGETVNERITVCEPKRVSDQTTVIKKTKFSEPTRVTEQKTVTEQTINSDRTIVSEQTTVSG